MFLPDVNVLIALAWRSHVHHRQARQWFDSLGHDPWATCPMTQTGFVRVSANARYVDEATSPQEAVEVLGRLTHRGQHEFWPDDLDLTASAAIPLKLLMGHRQVSDAYLLGQVIHRGGKLVTFDRGVSNLLTGASPHQAHIVLLA